MIIEKIYSQVLAHTPKGSSSTLVIKSLTIAIAMLKSSQKCFLITTRRVYMRNATSIPVDMGQTRSVVISCQARDSDARAGSTTAVPVVFVVDIVEVIRLSLDVSGGDSEAHQPSGGKRDN